ncbi:MAG: ABC transporter ATP-binding protein/permease, partial [Candidatus Omnitrophica bacterium]|nr:ABC transporter ATP-binding protein/permease [Candidatus Omnitrophota bacterium]
MKKYLKDYFKLLRFLKPFKKSFILASILMFFSAIFDGISLSMIIPVTDRLFTNKKIIISKNLPILLSRVVDKLNRTTPVIILKFIPLVVFILFFLKGLFFFFQNYLMNKIAQGVVRDVKDKLYQKFQELSLEFYAKKRTGELISRVTNDVGFIANALSYALTDLIYESMQLVVFATVAIYLGISISWKLFIVFIIFPLILYPIIRLGKRIKKFSIEIQKKMADLTSILAETIQGAYIVKVFCREDYELKRFKDINRQYYKFMMKSVKRIIVLSPLTEFLGAIAVAIILVIGGKQVIEGKVSFGVFGLFIASLLSTIRPLKKLSNVYAINQQAIAASNRIYNILDEEPKIKQPSDAYNISEFKEKIVYENIWFSYDEKEYVLEDINLTINKGEIIALVGPSGAGKSTLVSLLPRLYDPQKGRILIDNIDIKKVDLKSLRSLFSIVSQDMVLFNTTIRENIAYGKEGATEEEIIFAAKQAYAFEFINSLEKKFDTIVGDKAVRLSGGEKQRIAIARAILKNAPILILDEATSQLDSESEQLVKNAISNLMQDKTAIIIAHRLSTVQKANRIVVL